MSKTAAGRMNLSSYAGLTSSKTLGQFLCQQNDGSSQPSKPPKRVQGKANLSFCKLRSPSQKRRRMNSSKSYAKGCRINESAKTDLSFNGKHSRLESAYASEKANLYKEILSSSKKIKTVKPKTDAINALTKISKALQKMKVARGGNSAYSTMQTYSSQQRCATSGKFLNATTVANQRETRSSKKKHSDAGVVRKECSADAESLADGNALKQLKKSTQSIDHKKEIMTKLKNGLKDIETDLPKDEAIKRKLSIINDAFSDVIDLDDKFKGILRQIQLNYQEVCAEQELHYTSGNERLKSRLAEAEAELGEEKTRSEALEAEAAELARGRKAELEKLKKAQAEEVQKVKEAAGKKTKKLSDDLSALYGENKNLKKMVKRLCSELEKYKEVLKEMGVEEEEDKSELKENMPMMEVGKNKVRMPMLNFAALSPKRPAKLKVVQYCNGSDESDPEEVNDSANGECVVDEWSSNQEDVEGNLEAEEGYAAGGLNTN